MGKGDNFNTFRPPGSPRLSPEAVNIATNSNSSISCGSCGGSSNGGDKARQRAATRDTQIRKNASLSLAKRPGQVTSAALTDNEPPLSTAASSSSITHAVAHYELSPIETIPESNTVLEAVRHMAARHLDSLLVLDISGARLRGIITDQDVAFRVLAADLDPRTTTVAQVMTPDPRTIPAGTSITEALTVMVSNHFRHLPVFSDRVKCKNDVNHGSIICNSSGKGDPTKISSEEAGSGHLLGVLDIAKCLKDALQKLELADAAASQIASAMDAVRAIRGSLNDGSRKLDVAFSGGDSYYPLACSSPLEALRERLACPRISSLLRSEGDAGCTIVSSQGTTVRTAVQTMAQRQHTAAVVVNEQDHLIGIFTTKDVLLRVIAAGLEPATTSIVRVMTPHPDWTSPEQSIISALRQMHLGHFLHLPVVQVDTDLRRGSSSSLSSVSARKSLLGVVDVLQLTYAMLEQLNQLSHGTEGAASTPLWHQLWSPSPINGEGQSQLGPAGDPMDTEGYPEAQGGREGEGRGQEMLRLLCEQDPPINVLAREDEFTSLSTGILIKICHHKRRRGGFKNDHSDTGDTGKEVFLLPIENVFELPRLEMVLEKACSRFKLSPRTTCQLFLVDDDGDMIPIGEDEEFIKFVQFAMGSGKDRIILALAAVGDRLSDEGGSEEGSSSMRMALAGMTAALLFALGCWFLRSRG